MGRKPIVSVTYGNERISIKNIVPYIKCVLHLPCVVHGPIYGHFMGCTVNGFYFSLQYKVYREKTVYINSHDVNPIETFWIIVDQTTYKDLAPKTLDELRQ